MGSQNTQAGPQLQQNSLAQAPGSNPQQPQVAGGFGPGMQGLKTPGVSFQGAGVGSPQGGFNPQMLQQLLQQSKGGKPGMQVGPQRPGGNVGQATFGQPAGPMQFPGGGWGQ